MNLGYLFDKLLVTVLEQSTEKKKPTTIALRETISDEEARKIHEQYRRISVQRNKEWAARISLEDIMHWSEQPYWNALDNVRDKRIPYREFIPEMLKAYDMDFFEGIKFLAINLEPSRSRTVFPGLNSEYIRRFLVEDELKTHIDKAMHFAMGAYLTSRTGKIMSNTIGTAKEVIDAIFTLSIEEPMADLRAHFEGSRYSTRFQ